MSAELDFSPERIHKSGLAVKSSAEDFGETIQAFQSEVAGYGEPWGSDTIGQLIGIAHQVVFEAAMKCFVSNHQALHKHADNLTALAQTYAVAEGESTVEINHVRSILG